MRQLINHTWRVRTPSEATILVVPGFADVEKHCPHGSLTPHARVVSAIERTAEWQTRQRDHLFVAMHWTNHPWAKAAHAPGPPPGMPRGYLQRAFFEATIYDPLLHMLPHKRNTVEDWRR